MGTIFGGSNFLWLMKYNPTLAGSLRTLHLVFLMGSLSFLIISMSFSSEISRLLNSPKYYSESAIVSSLATVGFLTIGNSQFNKLAVDGETLDVDERYFSYKRAMFNQFVLANIAMVMLGILYMVFNRGLFITEAFGVISIQLALFPTKRRLVRVLKLEKS